MNEYVKNLNRIEFAVTMSCTGRCKHCSQGEHTNCTGHIDAESAQTAIREVCNKYKIESLMTFGGEPLLYPEVVCAIHNAAKEMGISKRDLITNGFFTKDSNRIEKVVKKLEDSGVCQILLSVDAFHQETIPLEPVKHFAECVSKSKINIKLSPAWLVSETDNNPYNERTREIIKEFDYLHIPVGSGNIIFPSGNALKYLNEYFDENAEYTSPYDENPKDIRAICFSPNGNVLDDNIYQKGILDILNNYQP
ncbi:MAG: radical SAM protein [Acetobacter sp.]|nr:radical SAM protein [Bacteroides sp.]MCM1340978.1 radical SAM protein [Acetobacter sp.]MCM1432466.1 radical SAM protein [Clostridiales bacterium]